MPRIEKRRCHGRELVVVPNGYTYKGLRIVRARLRDARGDWFGTYWVNDQHGERVWESDTLKQSLDAIDAGLAKGLTASELNDGELVRQTYDHALTCERCPREDLYAWADCPEGRPLAYEAVTRFIEMPAPEWPNPARPAAHRFTKHAEGWVYRNCLLRKVVHSGVKTGSQRVSEWTEWTVHPPAFDGTRQIKGFEQDAIHGDRFHSKRGDAARAVDKMVDSLEAEFEGNFYRGYLVTRQTWRADEPSHEHLYWNVQPLREDLPRLNQNDYLGGSPLPPIFVALRAIDVMLRGQEAAEQRMEAAHTPTA